MSGVCERNHFFNGAVCSACVRQNERAKDRTLLVADTRPKPGKNGQCYGSLSVPLYMQDDLILCLAAEWGETLAQILSGVLPHLEGDEKKHAAITLRAIRAAQRREDRSGGRLVGVNAP